MELTHCQEDCRSIFVRICRSTLLLFGFLFQSSFSLLSREDEFVIFELKYLPCSLSILYKGYRVVESRNLAMSLSFILSIKKNLLCFHALLFITWFLYFFDWHKQVCFVGNWKARILEVKACVQEKVHNSGVLRRKFHCVILDFGLKLITSL